MLQIYNTLAREKQVFKPITPNQVRMYVCGMTVYDYCHLGHARVMVVFDMVQRWLRASGYEVNYVRNITDIDDKIIKRALENNESIRELTDRFILAMHEDADALGIERPTHEPRATEYVPEMLGIIEQLEQNGLAYQATNGDVNYAVRGFKSYGKLSGKTLDDLRAGERVAVADDKRDPLDFVLWKSAKESEPADTKWPSKWGIGRPGWHIECSAMSSSLLGNHFDIHGGGADLQFPHHENEIAQSEGAMQCSDDPHNHNEQFVNYWMHNGFVRVDNEKMSKSLGNFFTIRDVLKEYDAEVVRFFILRAQYRSPLNYSNEHLNDAKSALTRLYNALKDIPVDDKPVDWTEAHAVAFKSAMDDDFNTAIAVSVLFDLATLVNKTQDVVLASQLKALAGVLGLLQREPHVFLQGGVQDDVAQIEALIESRKVAKAAKDFAAADAVRAQLTDMGIAIEDKAGGVVEWRRM
ncbi:cysteine--tRNA ligase [Formosimonas limnophila]|uniref:Cysteine--tRNA ligase n=1 Tax=Formosimonas limnophila TaxID=1384487 RepID=A0A8J3FZL0_9BURK|nr:cysteine--tRNA ligase [Formosimonas limnophila]GHA69489.1 cysteine--tRNA ligase [Formosimonas limnophila]